MAKKEEAPKIVLERNYNIPLRIATLKSPFHKKAKKAISTVKIFISKHMKTKEVKIGQFLNLKIWEHGMRNPPNLVKVTATKDDKGVVFVELVGAPKPQPKVEETKKSGKKESKPEGKVEAEFKEIKEETKEIKEEKAEEAKEIQKEEIKEMQKEHPKMHPPKMPSQPKVSQTHPTAPKSV
ncbi:MAG TPA: 50S ribosomal protein L31e [Candidatus Nanoarchaeia archaeon]|nr:50S ribosomal protein L31e [Candidatus Nanoarchaeia archaeon]